MKFLLFSLVFIGTASAAVSYAPVPLVNPAPLTYGSTYGGIPPPPAIIHGSSYGGVAPQPAIIRGTYGGAAPQPVIIQPVSSSVAQPQSAQVVDNDNYGVTEYLPTATQNTNQVHVVQPVNPVVQVAQPNPVPITVPVNQQVGFTQQVQVTNPQVVSQGYAPVPQVAPAPSAYGSSNGGDGYVPQTSGYGSAAVVSNQNIYTPNTAQVVDTDTDITVDSWSNGNTARGVRTKVASKGGAVPKKIKIL